MPRQPRPRSSIGFYHLYGRGTGGLVYFEDDADHLAQYDVHGKVVERHAWRIHAHCLMQTHHHLLPEPALHRHRVGCYLRGHGHLGSTHIGERQLPLHGASL